MVPHAERPQFSGTLLKRTRCPETSLKATLWMKAQHEGALTPPCIVRKNPQVPHSAQQVACHSVNNSKGKGKSIPPQKTRRDSLVHTLQVLCDPSQKWRGHLRFLPPYEMTKSDWSSDVCSSDLTAQQVACHSVNNSKGKRRSIPPRKTRRDSLVRTRQVLCDPSQKWRGPLRFLPPFEMRPSSIAPNPVE